MAPIVMASTIPTPLARPAHCGQLRGTRVVTVRTGTGGPGRKPRRCRTVLQPDVHSDERPGPTPARRVPSGLLRRRDVRRSRDSARGRRHPAAPRRRAAIARAGGSARCLGSQAVRRGVRLPDRHAGLPRRRRLRVRARQMGTDRGLGSGLRGGDPPRLREAEDRRELHRAAGTGAWHDDGARKAMAPCRWARIGSSRCSPGARTG